jgi:hypothetical protein
MSWYRLEQAVEKYCLESSQNLKWSDENLNRVGLPNTCPMYHEKNDVLTSHQNQQSDIKNESGGNRNDKP